MKKDNKYTIIKDSREQRGWLFEPGDKCMGMEVGTLSTGDYSIKGLENILTIERKGSTGEFATNINEDRFFRELKRMDNFQFSFLILEFTMEDIFNFPINSGIPSKVWPKLKVSSSFLLKRFLQIVNNEWGIAVILAGNKGEEVATAIFKQVLDIYNG